MLDKELRDIIKGVPIAEAQDLLQIIVGLVLCSTRAALLDRRTICEVCTQVSVQAAACSAALLALHRGAHAILGRHCGVSRAHRADLVTLVRHRGLLVVEMLSEVLDQLV